MKKTLSIILCLVLALSLFAACSKEDPPASDPPVVESDPPVVETDEPEDVPETDEPEVPDDSDDLPAAQGVEGKDIGICIYKFDDNFMTLYREELQRYLEAGGANVQVMDGKNDQVEQTNQINNFITQGVDVLIVNLVQSSAAPQVADLCHAADVPVVFINREPEEEEQLRWEEEGMQCTYVGADAKQSGTFQGELIADLPNNGDADEDGVIRYVMIMGDPENVDAQYRTEYSILALEDAGLEVENLFQERGDWDQVKGQELAATAIAANGDIIDVIFCNNDAMAMGAIQAIEAAGLVVGEDIYLVGVDALAEALEAIGGGRMTGTVFNDHFGQSRTAADVASDFVNGKDVKTIYVVDYVKITPNNAAEILDMLTADEEAA